MIGEWRGVNLGSRGCALLAGLGEGLLYRDVVDGEEPACSSRVPLCGWRPRSECGKWHLYTPK